MLRNLGLSFSLLALVACDASQQVTDPHIAFDKAIVDVALSELVSDGAVTGVSALIYQGGEEVYFGAFGQADAESKTPFRRDTLAAIYSMTKPITGVTLMSLYEEDLFDLDAPLKTYLPEYANVQVYAGQAEDGSLILEAPDRPIKVIDIFRHTSCFGYGWGDDPVSEMMNTADVLNPSKPLSQFSEELAEIPLYCQPGSEWSYSVSVDVQARLAETLTGQPYKDLVTDRVLGPLGMKETSYFVAPIEKPRIAAHYTLDEEGRLTRIADSEIYSFATEEPVLTSGGSGLISTLDDYMRFALMLQNEGRFADVQILKPETIALMAKDHLPSGITKRSFLPSKGQMGFGLNFAVRTAPPLNEKEPFGVTGEFFWDGAASTMFWVDPTTDLTAVFFIQVQPFDGASQAKFRRAVYDALGDAPKNE